MTKQFIQLTDYQWAAISPFLPLKRKRKLDLFEVMKQSCGYFVLSANGEIYPISTCTGKRFTTISTGGKPMAPSNELTGR